MTSAWRPLFALLLAGLCIAAAVARENDTIRLDVGGHRITVELAVTPSARERGLMHRDTLPDDHGMLFVYSQPERICMWMKNTSIPLSVAFLDDHGAIINIAEMRPWSLDIHCADRPARYALEMTSGWFARRGLKPGMRITGLAHMPAEP